MAEVVTGEAVVLDLAVAKFPSRMAALLIDMLVQGAFIVLLLLIIVFGLAQQLDTAALAATSISCYALVIVGYPTTFETLTRGKTLGKMALGLRVVSDDGSPIRFRQALLRALSLAFVEVWNPALSPVGMPAGLITAMISARGKRLGDLVAGTFVIQERVPRRADLGPGFLTVPPPLAAWARNLELSRLSDQTAAAASGYLRRLNDLRPAARDQLGWQLASSVAAQVSPPPPEGTPPAAYLTAVLAVRREREQARLGVPQTPQASGYPAAWPVHQATGYPAAPPRPSAPGYPAAQPTRQAPGNVAGQGGQFGPEQAYQPGIIPPLPEFKADHDPPGGPLNDDVTPGADTAQATAAKTVTYTTPLEADSEAAAEAGQPDAARTDEPADFGFSAPT